MVTTRKEAAQTIQKTLNAKSGAIKKHLKIERATAADLNGAIQSAYEPLRVTDFRGARQTRKGVTVRMRTDKPRKLFAHAFIATMKSGHRGAYIRARDLKRWTKGRRGPRSQNLPIVELFGPNDQTVFGENLDDLVKLSNKELDKKLAAEIDWALRRERRRAR